VFDEKFMWMDF